jgi:hypothetical protein
LDKVRRSNNNVLAGERDGNSKNSLLNKHDFNYPNT